MIRNQLGRQTYQVLARLRFPYEKLSREVCCSLLTALNMKSEKSRGCLSKITQQQVDIYGQIVRVSVRSSILSMARNPDSAPDLSQELKSGENQRTTKSSPGINPIAMNKFPSISISFPSHDTQNRLSRPIRVPRLAPSTPSLFTRPPQVRSYETRTQREDLQRRPTELDRLL